MTLTEEQREAIRAISKLPMAIGCQLCHPYIMENYGSHFIVLRAMIDGSSMVEPREGFDLEAARAALVGALKPGGYHDQETARIIHTHMPSLLAEIERLRADMEQSERVIEARLDVIDQQAARIKSLKKEIRRLKHESKVEQELTNSYIKHLHEAEARIKALEEAHKRSGAKYAKIINELRSSVYANIPGLDVGKIGPDAKPRSWQITEERIGLLEYCLETLLDAPDIEEIPGPGHSIEMLRAMLREAEQ